MGIIAVVHGSDHREPSQKAAARRLLVEGNIELECRHCAEETMPGEECGPECKRAASCVIIVVLAVGGRLSG